MNRDICPSIVICVFAALVCLLFAASARAGDAPECSDRALAEQLDAKAGARFDEGDYLGALVGWQEAYEACQNPTTLWNIARSHEELKELTRARAFFLLHRDFPRLPEDRVAATDARIEAITGALLAWGEIKEEADGFFASRSFEEALDRYEKAQAIQRTPDVMVRAAECLKATGRLDQALAMLEGRERFSVVSEIDTARVRKGVREIKILLLAEAEAAREAKPTPAGAPIMVSKFEGEDSNSGLKIAGWTATASGVGVLIAGSLVQRGGQGGGGQGGGGQGGGDQGGGGGDALRAGLFVTGGLLTLTGAALLTFGYLREIEPEEGPVEKIRLDVGPGSVGVSGEF